MKSTIRKLVPHRARRALRHWLHFVASIPGDMLDSLAGTSDTLLPPRSKILVGKRRDFKAVGDAYANMLIHWGGLRPDNRILDVGCGIGRIAVPLTRYLSEQGEYCGFDINPMEIGWCRKNISSRFPNFHFTLADIYNKSYNASGKNPASEYRFPYPEESFDFVFLGSVFTHMVQRDLEHYFSEIVRVLKPGARCLITFFLINDESRALLEGGKSSIAFRYRSGPAVAVDESAREEAIAYDETYIREIYAREGLEIIEPVLYGAWCGRARHFGWQDGVLGTRRP